MKPHKHAEVIKAWADGHAIQYRNGTTNPYWTDMPICSPNWHEDVEYRVKPEPKPDIVAVGILELDGVSKPHNRIYPAYHTEFRVSEHWEADNVRVTFDGETGKLKLAEVLSA